MQNTLTKKRLVSLFGALAIVCGGVTLSARADDKPDFVKDVQPILQKSCVSCHGGIDPKTSKPKIKGKLDLTTKELAMKGGDVGKDKDIVPGKAEDSLLYKLLLGPVGKGDDEIKRMPAGKKDAPLSDVQIKVIKAWIDGGANWPDGVKLSSDAK